MVIEKRTHHEFKTGSTIVGTTAARLADSQPARHGVRIQADHGNSGTVSVGDWPLAAGESITIPVDDPNKITVSGSEGDTVRWMAI